MSWERNSFIRLLVFKTDSKRLQGWSQSVKLQLYFGLMLVDSRCGNPGVEASRLFLKGNKVTDYTSENTLLCVTILE